MEISEAVILLDSLGDIQTNNTRPILVCASHCGDNGSFARKLQNCHVKAVFLNNAGIGKNQAGISGLPHYEAAQILACAVDHESAEIGVARDTWDSGVISHTNRLAEEAGIHPGDSVQHAVALLSRLAHYSLAERNMKAVEQLREEANNTQHALKKQTRMQIGAVEITVADSITFLDAGNAGDIAVCGSHGGVSAGEYAQKRKLKAVFFNDAGIGKNNAGIKSLDSLSKAGILACTIDCMTAEIFDGMDMLNNGIISVCNELAKSRNIKEKMTIREAISYI